MKSLILGLVMKQYFLIKTNDVLIIFLKYSLSNYKKHYINKKIKNINFF